MGLNDGSMIKLSFSSIFEQHWYKSEPDSHLIDWQGLDKRVVSEAEHVNDLVTRATTSSKSQHYYIRTGKNSVTDAVYFQ